MVTTYTLALFGHVLGVLLFSAGIAVAGTAFETARRRSAPSDIAAILGIARAGVPLVGAGAMMTLGFGLWLVHLGRWGYGTGWVSAALTLFIVAMVLGAAGGRAPKRARLHANQLVVDEREADEKLFELLHDRPSRTFNYISTVLLLVILMLMIFKP